MIFLGLPTVPKNLGRDCLLSSVIELEYLRAVQHNPQQPASQLRTQGLAFGRDSANSPCLNPPRLALRAGALRAGALRPDLAAGHHIAAALPKRVLIQIAKFAKAKVDTRPGKKYKYHVKTVMGTALSAVGPTTPLSVNVISNAGVPGIALRALHAEG